MVSFVCHDKRGDTCEPDDAQYYVALVSMWQINDHMDWLIEMWYEHLRLANQFRLYLLCPGLSFSMQ